MEKFLTLTEAARSLGVEEAEVVKLADKGIITAYRIGGNFLRFRLKDIEGYRKRISAAQINGLVKEPGSKELRRDAATDAYRLKDKIYDFFYYHDFYIIVVLIIILLLIVIFRF